MSMCLCHPAKEFSMVLDVIITINQSVMMFCNRLNKTTLISAVKRTCGLPCALTLSNLSPLHFSTDTLSKVEQMVGNSDMHITRVLFCGPYFPASHQYTKEYLQKYPFIQVDDVPLAFVPDVISNYNICIVKNMRLTSNIISRATQMKLIMQFGVGLEGVDIDAATKYGIKVARIPGDVTGNAASCAEMTIYLISTKLRLCLKVRLSYVDPLPLLSFILGQNAFWAVMIPNHFDSGTSCSEKAGLSDSKPVSDTVVRLLFSCPISYDSVILHASPCQATFQGALSSLLRGHVSVKSVHISTGFITTNEMQISIKQKRLGVPVGETLLGKTVFIMGFGNIGIDLAKRLRPFGVKIIATKRSWALHSEGSLQSDGFLIENGTNDNLVDEKGSHEDIYKFAGESDIVVCCLSMNKETAGIVNKSFISSMKKGALLVNIARGGLLDYDAVVHHLESGHLGGLGIDVAWTEPFDPDDPILKFNNVIISPHVAGVTEHSYRSMAKVVGDVVLQLHSGTPLAGIEIVN
ncbi:hypothetical protein POTOM_044427 [Populus tomentosa]|uniref:D-isomer specific 2-hydroxyacid dehydrogenase family protein n=1 Tax=Populus tomentosa TaxID=118781 RepID=A0A8X7YK85_POPTO|nr:hypothetical protein POTOM_044427 [Populus tomentosa]